LMVPFGLISAVVAIILRGYLVMPYQVWVMRKEVGVAPAIISRNLLPPLWASLFMAAALLALRPLLRGYVHGALPFACLAAVLGMALYLAGLLIFSRVFLVSQYTVLRPFLQVGPKHLTAERLGLPLARRGTAGRSIQ